MNYFLITLALILIIAIVLNYYVRKSYKNDKRSLTLDYKNFVKAVEETNSTKIEEIGSKLVYNKHLKQNQLDFLAEEFEKRKNQNKRFEKLYLDAYNKQLHYARILPESGSSGGIPQSW